MMNMTQLANLVGVSVSTVSKAFSGSKEIPDTLRLKIFEAAKSQGCYEKYIGRYRQKPLIGVICHEFKGGHYSEHLYYMEEEIKKKNGIMIVSSSDFDANRTQELMEYFENTLKVNGMIVYSNGQHKQPKIPTISIGGTIKVSNEKAIKQAIEYFYENAHRKIAYIGESHTESTKNAFKKAMSELNLEIIPEYIVTVSSRFESAGIEAMDVLFNCEQLPTAIFAAYDHIALGAIKSIQDHGLKIPEDISIIGMNDNETSKYLNIPLTTITSYNEDLCQIIVETLFEQIEGKQVEKTQINLNTELIKRNSVGKAKE